MYYGFMQPVKRTKSAKEPENDHWFYKRRGTPTDCMRMSVSAVQDPCGLPMAQICTRLPYHDGPCNGYQSKQCELKNRLEREGKIMITKPDDVTIISANKDEPVTIPGLRGLFSQAWAWITGRL